MALAGYNVKGKIMFAEVINEIRLNGLVPVLKFKNVSDAIPTCQALRRGGLNVAEITFRTEAAEESIKAVCHAMPEMLVGAGTVTKIEQAERAVASGAKFIVAPGFNPHIVEWCISHNVAVLPGINNPLGIEQAIELGISCLKFFPAEASGGVKFINAIHAPYNSITFIPTGGINEENLSEYLSSPGVVACGGSWMVPTSAIEAGQYEVVENLVRKAIRKMLSFELAHVGVNCGNEDEAITAANKFNLLFGFETKPGNSSVFAGSAVELMKAPYLGTKGHIGIKTASIDRAVYFLKGAGFAFNESSRKIDAKGNLKAIYLADEIAGFAVHLVQK